MAEPGRLDTRKAASPVTRAKPAQCLAFSLLGETFAIGILHIKEVIQHETLTEVPLMPPYVRGIINLRGAVVPVLDLAIRFGRAATETARRTCIVILEVPRESGPTTLGILVDHVNEVVDVDPSQVDPAPDFESHIDRSFIHGIARLESGFVILLDVTRVLSASEFNALAGRQDAEQA